MEGAISGMVRKRNRPVTAREPNGRIQREANDHSPTAVRRLRDAALRGMHDPEWGTELGRLFLSHAISDTMYGAGKKWRDQAARYRSAIGVFPVRTASLERGRSASADPDSEGGRQQASRETLAAEEFFAAHAALVMAGMGAENAVRRLCEDDLSLVGMYELRNARCGLAVLADHYGLTEKGKSSNVR
jgi:hypothetical protein